MSSDDASADTDDEWERNIPQTAEIENLKTLKRTQSLILRRLSAQINQFDEEQELSR